MGYADLTDSFVFRRVFGQHADVLRGLLNDFLGRSGAHAIESLEYLPPDQVPDIPEVKHSIVDVKCREVGGATFVVEMQVNLDEQAREVAIFARRARGATPTRSFFATRTRDADHSERFLQRRREA